MQLGERRDLPQMAEPAGMRHRRPDVVDQMFLDQHVAVEDGVEHLADRDRRGRVMADDAERLLQLRRHRILHPEQPVGLERLAERTGLDRCQPVVHVMQEVQVVAELTAQPVEHRGHEVEIALAAPDGFERAMLLRRFVRLRSLGDAVSVIQPRDAALRADRGVSEIGLPGDGMDGVVERLAVRVRVDHDAIPRRPAEQLVDRHVERLAANIPERHVHGGNRRHRHRAAAPVGALVEVLPCVLDAPRVAADEQRHDMLAQIAGDRELPSIQRPVAQTVDAVLGHQLERDEVASRTRDDDLTVDYAHD
jgi:hypothetical protein